MPPSVNNLMQLNDVQLTIHVNAVAPLILAPPPLLATIQVFYPSPRKLSLQIQSTIK